MWICRNESTVCANMSMGTGSSVSLWSKPRRKSVKLWQLCFLVSVSKHPLVKRYEVPAARPQTSTQETSFVCNISPACIFVKTQAFFYPFETPVPCKWKPDSPACTRLSAFLLQVILIEFLTAAFKSRNWTLISFENSEIRGKVHVRMHTPCLEMLIFRGALLISNVLVCMTAVGIFSFRFFFFYEGNEKSFEWAKQMNE